MRHPNAKLVHVRQRAAYMTGVLLALVLLVGTLVGPLDGTRHPARAQDDDGFPRAVIDAAGATVVIPTRPARVLVIGTVPGLGQIVPPDALRRVDPRDDPAVALADDVGLLVLPELYAAAYPAWVAAAAAQDVPVFRVGALTSRAAWRDWLATAGAITGRETAARDAVRRLETALRLAGWIARWRNPHADPVRVLVLTPERYTVGRGALLTELIAAAGGVNVAAAAGYADVRQIGEPALRDLAPDAILLTPAWGAAGRAAFVATPAYVDLPAVAAGRVCLLPFDSTRITRPGAVALRLALLLRAECGM